MPLVVLGALIAGLMALTVLAGAASSSCEESVGALSSKVPSRLVPIYERAAAKYGLGEQGPSILAGINWVETGFGTNLGVSSAEAEGWMQFLPSSWEAYGVDGNGDGTKDPYNPWDAIFAAARLLRASGAPEDWHGAIFSYNHAEWYVSDVLEHARRFADDGAVETISGTGCASGPGAAVVDQAIRLYAPRAFKPIPPQLWVGDGSPEAVDVRIWPDAVWLLETYDLRVKAAREPGHETHGDGTAMDMVPVAGRGWDGTTLKAALALGWIPSCGWNGAAPVCPLVPAIEFIGYNGYDSNHGDPAHSSTPHLHVSWKSSEYGCPGLCEPREWVEVFPWRE
ncbi:MAG TPA: lytic transglycosylase domain-containing protein [Solirubrobacterales bacterium]|nr:lytic transglycosylase domain-containing protein [Solirubrobacterales bacterium]